jgi:hypothetical protein
MKDLTWDLMFADVISKYVMSGEEVVPETWAIE